MICEHCHATIGTNQTTCATCRGYLAEQRRILAERCEKFLDRWADDDERAAR